MTLAEQWRSSPEQIEEKKLRQLIGFAGEGRLREQNVTSREFREFLAQVPSRLLKRYAEECLEDTFPDNGLALQDIVNEAGRRLGFQVTDGRYRGAKGEPGNDGLWCTPAGNVIVIEVKVTDAYRIDLNRIAEYGRMVSEQQAKQHPVNLDTSALIVVGRTDTGDLEAQIRGSRYAWEMRVISVEALLRLVALKEEVDEPQTVEKIHSILLPHEYTRLDDIVDLVFRTTEDAKSGETEERVISRDRPDEKTKKFTPVAFNDACAERVSRSLGKPLVKRTRATFSTPDKSTVVICIVSKKHEDPGENYWFAFHPHQLESMKSAPEGYVALGCGSPDLIFLIPSREFESWLPGMNITELDDQKIYWHIQVYLEKGVFNLARKKGEPRIPLTKYQIKT
jgi:hypothetical protein